MFEYEHTTVEGKLGLNDRRLLCEQQLALTMHSQIIPAGLTRHATVLLTDASQVQNVTVASQQVDDRHLVALHPLQPIGFQQP